MKKTWKRLFCLALLTALCLGGSMAFSDGNGQLTVKIGKDSSPFQRKGIEVELFRISENAVGDDWSMLPDFSSVTLPTTSTAQKTEEALSDIRKIILEKGIEPTASGATDSEGRIVFPNLQTGVYYGRMTKGPKYLQVQDFLVSVPQKQNGKWVYSAEAELKYDYVTPKPTAKPTPKPAETPTPTPTPVPPPGKTTPTPEVTAVPTATPRPTPTPTPRPYRLVIHYIYADTGETVWPDYSDTLWEGEEYDILSPIIPDYWYDIPEVSGTMPGRDLEYTVMYYTQKPGWSYYRIKDYETALGIGMIQMHVGVCFE